MSADRGYAATLRHPTARRLWVAAGVSTTGDYVGQGALLLLAFERAGGRVIGPAALFAIQALPALLSGGLAGSWLDQVPRRNALSILQVFGAAALAMPLLLPGLAPVLVAAAALGAMRAASASVRSGAVAEGVPAELRGPLLALFGTTAQSAQVVGYLTGAGIAVTIGVSTALLVDAVALLAGAVVIATMPFPPPRPRDRRPPVTAGLREILRHPVMRLLAPLVWVTATVGALPETLAAGATEDASGWTPFVLAAGPAGQAITMAVLGGYRRLIQPSFQLTHFAWLALAFGIAALGRGPVWYLVGNLLVGSGIAWLLGPQTTFVRVAPPERMAQITGTMIALIIAIEGLGTLVFATIADATSVSVAYRIAGFVVLATAVGGWLRLARSREIAELEEI